MKMFILLFRSTLFVSLVFILFLACTKPADLTKTKSDLLKTDLDFTHMSQEKGAAEAFNMYLAEESLQLSAQSQPIMGRQNIYESMKESNNQSVLAWNPKNGEVASSGDMGYTWGTYTYSWKDPQGQSNSVQGKYGKNNRMAPGR